MIDGLQRDYGIASQTAEQIVGLEPVQAELPASATDAQREAAEKDYVARFTQYVDTQERPAYGAALEKAADWRNAILRAEYFGFGEKKPSVTKMERGWEKKIRQAVAGIGHINEFSKKVGQHVAMWREDHPRAKDLPKWLKEQIKEREELRAKLPMLRFEDGELRKVLGEARGSFYPGFENPVEPPAAPLAGSGSFEDRLIDVQGVHWPDQHSLLGSLPAKRVAGMLVSSIGTYADLDRGTRAEDRPSALEPCWPEQRRQLRTRTPA